MGVGVLLVMKVPSCPRTMQRLRSSLPAWTGLQVQNTHGSHDQSVGYPMRVVSMHVIKFERSKRLDVTNTSQSDKLIAGMIALHTAHA